MLSIIAGGLSTDIEALAKLVSYDGWGAAPFHQIASRGPMQHGETYLDYRLDARHGTLVFRLDKSTLTTMYDARTTLLNLFKPNNLLVLQFTLPDTAGTVRRIEGYASPGLTLPWTAADWAAQKFTVDVYCPDPTFYDPTGEALSFSLGGGTGAFTVPTEVPTGVGSGTIDQSFAKSYVGSAPAYPTLIRITGPIDDAIITNDAGPYTLDFTGFDLAAGHTLDIDLRYGYKTVKYDGVTNYINKLTEASDLADWRLEPSNDSSSARINTIRVTGSSCNSATAIAINWFNRYLGF